MCPHPTPAAVGLRRFARCGTVDLRTPSGRAIEATLATTPAARLLGLTRVEPERIGPLLLLRCDAVHGFWMRADLDVCFLAMPAEGSSAVVLDVRVLRRRRSVALARGLRRGTPRRRVAALELPTGTTSRLGLASGAAVAIGHAGAVRT
ncbi:hypothetical protein HJD18_05645 [Thermoleophilia bacterium SCSIO 60948]|nr:hypothetical protein HJD18_05645 [Thermoleophilia bacterium SCSIO 60948]